jgi:hypothetical protein
MASDLALTVTFRQTLRIDISLPVTRACSKAFTRRASPREDNLSIGKSKTTSPVSISAETMPSIWVSAAFTNKAAVHPFCRTFHNFRVLSDWQRQGAGMGWQGCRGAPLSSASAEPFIVPSFRPWQDYIVGIAERLVGDFDVDGIFLDSWGLVDELAHEDGRREDSLLSTRIQQRSPDTGPARSGIHPRD